MIKQSDFEGVEGQRLSERRPAPCRRRRCRRNGRDEGFGRRQNTIFPREIVM